HNLDDRVTNVVLGAQDGVGLDLGLASSWEDVPRVPPGLRPSEEGVSNTPRYARSIRRGPGGTARCGRLRASPGCAAAARHRPAQPAGRVPARLGPLPDDDVAPGRHNRRSV